MPSIVHNLNTLGVYTRTSEIVNYIGLTHAALL